MTLLSILFLVTAVFYSSVGFGGGSTYLALMLIWGAPYTIFPILALACNIVVVLGNCFNYIRAGNLNLRMLSPYLIGSIPLSFLGGSLSIDKKIFEILLFLTLTLAGTLLLLNFKSYDNKNSIYKKIPKILSISVGGAIGFISGMVGIGGGIFLSPVLFLLRSGRANHIVTAASLFILINSISGIVGQLTKQNILTDLSNYWFLVLAVFIGGQLGNFLNLEIISSRVLVLITSLLVIFVAIRLAFEIFNL